MIVRSLALCAPFALLVGCAQTDPYQRPGQWRPIGANAINLRAMVADPRDLDAGRGATVSPGPGDIAAAAVVRLRQDKVRPLPVSGLSSVQPGGQTPQPQTGGATPASADAAPSGGAAPAAAP